MAHTVALTSLSPREAVADALYRCVTGIDDHDQAVFESACLKSDDISFAAGERVVKGWDAINEYISTKIMTLKTLHCITNVRVNLKGPDTAYMTAHAIAYHYNTEDAFKPEGKPFTTAGLYFIDVVRDASDGLWKINHWQLKLKWTDGDRAVITG
jgi:hypothetical protein